MRFTSIRSRLVAALLSAASVAFLGHVLGILGLTRLTDQVTDVSRGIWPAADTCMEYWIGSLAKMHAMHHYAQGDEREAERERAWAEAFVESSLQRLERTDALPRSTLESMARLHRRTSAELAAFFRSVDHERELVRRHEKTARMLAMALHDIQVRFPPHAAVSKATDWLMWHSIRHGRGLLEPAAGALESMEDAVPRDGKPWEIPDALAALRAARLDSETIADVEARLAEQDRIGDDLVQARRARKAVDASMNVAMGELAAFIAPLEESMDMAMDRAGRRSVDIATRTRLGLAAVALLSLAGAVAIGLLTTKSIVNPLRRLTDMTGTVAEGRWTESVGISRSDEIGELALRFDRMGADLARSHELLKASESRYRTLFEYARDGLAVLDSEGTILEANRTFGRLVGCSGQGGPGGSIHAIVPSQDRATFTELLHREPGRDHPAIRVKGRGGAIRIMEASAVRLPDECLLLQLVDVTEKRRLDQALIQAEKLSAIGQLAAGVAHELRNPLFAITNVLYELRDAKDTPAGGNNAAMLESIDIATQEGARARSIIDNLLAFARPSPPESRRVDTEEALEQILRLFRSSLKERNITLDVCCRDSRRCRFNPDAFKQVVVNLLSNAVEAMPEGGRLSISTAVTSTGNVRLQVADTGVGISQERQKEIFTPFFSTKEQGRGTGLGLWIVHSTVERYKGRVWVDSVEGEGTMFTLELPAEAA